MHESLSPNHNNAPFLCVYLITILLAVNVPVNPLLNLFGFAISVCKTT